MQKALVLLAIATAGGLLALYGEGEALRLAGTLLFVPTAFRSLALLGERAVEGATPFGLLALATALTLEGGPPGLAALGVALGGWRLLPLLREGKVAGRKEGAGRT